jgi:WD40 repeat protein
LNITRAIVILMMGGCTGFSNSNDQLMIECQLNDRNIEYTKLTYGAGKAISQGAFSAFTISGNQLNRLKISEKGCVYGSSAELNSHSRLLVVGQVDTGLYLKNELFAALKDPATRELSQIDANTFSRPQFLAEPKAYVKDSFSPVINQDPARGLLGFMSIRIDGTDEEQLLPPGTPLSNSKLDVSGLKEGTHKVSYKFHDIFTPDYQTPVLGQTELVVDRTAPQLSIELPRSATFLEVNPKDKVSPVVADASEVQHYYCVESEKEACEYKPFDGQYEAPETGTTALRFKAVDQAGNSSEEIKLKLKVFNQRAISKAISLLVSAEASARTGKSDDSYAQLFAAQAIHDKELKQQSEKDALKGPLLQGAINTASNLNVLKDINPKKPCSTSNVILADRFFACLSRSGNELVAYDLDKKKEIGSEKIDFSVRTISAISSTRILVQGRDGEFQVFDLKSGLQKANPFGALGASVKPLNVDQNSGHFIVHSDKGVEAFGREPGSRRTWAIATKDLLKAYVIGDSSSLLAVYSTSPEIRIFSKEGGELGKIEFPGGIEDLEFSPSGDYAVAWSTTGQMKGISLKAQMAESFSFKVDQPLSSVAISHDGKYFSVANGSLLKRFRSDGSDLGTSTGHEDAIVGLTYSKDDEYVATASNDGTVRIWKGVGRELNRIKLPPEAGRPLRILTKSFEVSKPVLVFTDMGLIKEILLAPIAVHQTKRMADRIVGHVASDDGKAVHYLSRDGELRALDPISRIETKVMNVKADGDGQALGLCRREDGSLVIGFDSGSLKSLRAGKLQSIIKPRAGKTSQMICGESIFLVSEEKDIQSIDKNNKVKSLGASPSLFRLYSHGDKHVILTFDGEVQIKSDTSTLKTFSGCDTTQVPELNGTTGRFACATEGGIKLINVEKATEEVVKTQGQLDRAFEHEGRVLGFSSGRLLSIDGKAVDLSMHEGPIKVLVSAGDKLISFGEDLRIKLWKMEGTELKLLGESFHLQNFVELVTVVPGDRYLVFSTWTMRYSARYFGVEANDNRLQLLPLDSSELIKMVGARL